MKRRGSAVLWLTAALCLGGCQWFLPPGDPPPGPITDNHPAGEFTPKDAENRLITLLATYMLTHPDCREFRLEAAPESLVRLERIFGAAAVTGGGRLSPDAKAVISADFSTSEWRCGISGSDPWRETLLVTADRSRP